MVASASFDGTVRLWETDGCRPLAVLQGHVGGVWGVAFDQEGQIVASGGDDGTVRLWDVRSGGLLRTLRLERRYEALDVTGLTGITDAQRSTLVALGAIERRARAVPGSSTPVLTTLASDSFVRPCGPSWQATTLQAGWAAMRAQDDRRILAGERASSCHLPDEARAFVISSCNCGVGPA